jgi:hypothetical protein
VDRSNHYEAAFEAFLRDRRVGFVPVDEAKRTFLGDSDVKSLDFIVVDAARLVVDVKGRRFPGGPAGNPRKVWQNWSEEEDVEGLARWAAHFGPGFRGVLAFVYHIEPPFKSAGRHPGPVRLPRPGVPDAGGRGRRVPGRDEAPQPAVGDRPPPDRRLPPAGPPVLPLPHSSGKFHRRGRGGRRDKTEFIILF